MSFVTKRGDDGSADACAADRQRVRKDDAVFDALGTLDELQCVLGVARCVLRRTVCRSGSTVEALLRDVQLVLSRAACVALLPACVADAERAAAVAADLVQATEAAERSIASFELPPMRGFVVPGDGCEAAALLHHGRSVCRRAERCVVRVATTTSSSSIVPPALTGPLLRFMNRCSDLLFACALRVDQEQQQQQLEQQLQQARTQWTSFGAMPSFSCCCQRAQALSVSLTELPPPSSSPLQLPSAASPSLSVARSKKST